MAATTAGCQTVSARFDLHKQPDFCPSLDRHHSLHSRASSCDQANVSCWWCRTVALFGPTPLTDRARLVTPPKYLDPNKTLPFSTPSKTSHTTHTMAAAGSDAPPQFKLVLVGDGGTGKVSRNIHKHRPPSCALQNAACDSGKHDPTTTRNSLLTSLPQSRPPSSSAI